MRLDLAGHPLHTRSLSVVVDGDPDGQLRAAADLVDLRKRGFTPVGTEVQGAGVIHQMGVEARVDPRRRELLGLRARQGVVAFEASAATRGESCRDVAAVLAALNGMRVDDAAGLRAAMGGAAGCSHLLAAAQLLCATLASLDVPPDPAPESVHRQLLRRDVVFDGHETVDGRLLVAVQSSDLHTAAAVPGVRQMDRFRRHDELRLLLTLEGWPAVLTAADGAERFRTAADFAAAEWRRLDLAALRGVSLGRGATQAMAAASGGNARLRDTLAQLGGMLIQCRASFPDKWLNAAAREGHPGLVGMADSCYMWRRGGALERVREGWPGPR